MQPKEVETGNIRKPYKKWSWKDMSHVLLKKRYICDNVQSSRNQKAINGKEDKDIKHDIKRKKLEMKKKNFFHKRYVCVRNSFLLFLSFLSALLPLEFIPEASFLIEEDEISPICLKEIFQRDIRKR